MIKNVFLKKITVIFYLMFFTLLGCDSTIYSEIESLTYKFQLGYAAHNKDVTLTVYKYSKEDIASVIEIDGEIVKGSITYPYTYNKKFPKGTYVIKLLYSNDYIIEDNNVILKEPVSEASILNLKVK